MGQCSLAPGWDHGCWGSVECADRLHVKLIFRSTCVGRGGGGDNGSGAQSDLSPGKGQLSEEEVMVENMCTETSDEPPEETAREEASETTHTEQRVQPHTRGT